MGFLIAENGLHDHVCLVEYPHKHHQNNRFLGQNLYLVSPSIDISKWTVSKIAFKAFFCKTMVQNGESALDMNMAHIVGRCIHKQTYTTQPTSLLYLLISREDHHSTWSIYDIGISAMITKCLSRVLSPSKCIPINAQIERAFQLQSF